MFMMMIKNIKIWYKTLTEIVIINELKNLNQAVYQIEYCGFIYYPTEQRALSIKYFFKFEIKTFFP